MSSRCRIGACEVSMPPSSPCSQLHLLDDLRDVPVRGRAPASRRTSAAPGAARAGPGRPRRCRRAPGRIGGDADLVLEARAPRARSSCRRSGRRRRTSSRDRRSAGRIPRCGRRTARRGGAGRTRRAGRSGPRVSRNATRSSPSSRTRTGGQSGSAAPSASSAGIQYRRIVSPIGVPGPTRVISSLSSRDSIVGPSHRRGGRPIGSGDRASEGVYHQAPPAARLRPERRRDGQRPRTPS